MFKLTYVKEARNFEMKNFKMILTRNFPKGDRDCFPFHNHSCII
jgi:hypothetical protein